MNGTQMQTGEAGTPLLSQIAEYCQHGFVLVPIPTGRKGPNTPGWNKRENCVFDADKAAGLTGNIGLAHAYSRPRTAVIDIDDYPVADKWLSERGIDLAELLTAPGAVLIDSGRENRAKLLYRLPAGLDPIPTIQPPGTGLEFRCATKNGMTVQDLLPGSIHPDTGKPYTWGGNGDWRQPPELPAAILDLWCELVAKPSETVILFNTSDVSGGPVVQGGAVPEGQRNTEFTRRAGAMRRIGMTPEVIEAALVADNLACGAGLPQSELQTIAKSVGRYAPANDGRTDVMPLRRPIPPAEPYPLDTLGPILGDAARIISEVEQIPAALCAQAVLVAAAHAGQQHFNVKFHFGSRPISLYAISVAESGDRKSRADTLASIPVNAKQRELLKQYKADAAEFELHSAVFQKAKQKASNPTKGSSVEAALRAVSDLGPEPVPPRPPTLCAADATYEAIVKTLDTGYPSMLMASDEGGQFFGGHSMRQETKTATIAGLSKVWDCGELDRMRAGDGNSKLYGRRVSAHWMLQPIIAENVFSDDLLQGQGFLARCLVCAPESLAGTRLLCNEDGTPAALQDVTERPEVQLFHGHMNRLWDRPPAFTEDGELDTVDLPLSKGAEDIYCKFHDAIEQKLSPQGLLKSVKPFASKSAEIAGRIAGIFTAVEIEAPRTIEADRMKRAAILMEWYVGEAVRLRDSAAIPQNIRRAEALETWATEKGKNRFHLSEVYQFGPQCIRNKQAAKAAAKTLEDHGRIVDLTDGGAIPVLIGETRRKFAWELVPEVQNGTA